MVSQLHDVRCTYPESSPPTHAELIMSPLPNFFLSDKEKMGQVVQEKVIDVQIVKGFNAEVSTCTMIYPLPCIRQASSWS